MSKNKAWSFSKLEAFERCPKKLWHEQIAKDVPQDPETEIQAYGIAGHKAFENYVLSDKPLPLDFKHHKKQLDMFKNIKGEKLPEQKLAIDTDYIPAGWFDKNVYCRAVIDYVVINRDRQTATIVDWKFGKKKEGFDQVELCAAVLSCFEPELKAIVAAYYWAKSREVTRKIIYKQDVMDIWGGYVPRVAEYHKAVDNSEFPAKENFLCGSYCAVTQCAHNGRSKS